jgi:hypothetical protein
MGFISAADKDLPMQVEMARLESALIEVVSVMQNIQRSRRKNETLTCLEFQIDGPNQLLGLSSNI